MKPVTKAHIAVFCTNLFFASNYSMVKYISPSLVKPYALNIFRVSISLILFWILWLVGKSFNSQNANKAGIDKVDIGRFFLCGLTGIAINQTLFIKGLTLTSPIHASLLMLCTPLLITFIAFWVLKEKVTLLKIFGLALGIAGSLILIMTKENTGHAGNSLIGDLLIVMNAISYALYFILVKPLMVKYSPVHVIRWVFTCGFIMIFPFGWVQFSEIQWQQFEWGHITSLSFIVFAGTFLAYYFTIYGIQHIGAGVTGSYIYTQPIIAAIIAIIFLHEYLTIEKLLAGLMIFLGVFFVSRTTPPIIEE